MLNQKQVNTLIDKGYGMDIQGIYLFKTISCEGLHNFTTIFINISDAGISFEGMEKYKDKLLNEALEVINND